MSSAKSFPARLAEWIASLHAMLLVGLVYLLVRAGQSRPGRKLANSRLAQAMRASPTCRRIYTSLTVRPWVSDIGLGIVTMWWGFWVGLHHEQVAMAAGFAVFRPILPWLAGFIFILGALQIWFALVKDIRGRQIVSLIGMSVWGGITSGLTVASGQAAYSGYVVFNALILLRAS